MGLNESNEWSKFEPGSAEDSLCLSRAQSLKRIVSKAEIPAEFPHTTGIAPTGSSSSQEAFGRVLTEVSRNEAIRPYLVTTAPDVATSTNLGGFINRHGIFNKDVKREWNDTSIQKWVESPKGQHIELGISEMNLFTLLGQL